MISNISFGSTYKVNNKANDYYTFSQFQKFALNKENRKDTEVIFKDCVDSKYPYDYSAQYIMIAPDSMDNKIETYCANRGIAYQKITKDELLNEDSILSRIKLPKTDMRRVYIDAEKLEELAKNQQTNIDYCKDDYSEYFKDKLNKIIKSDEDITATTLSIHGYSSYGEDIDYIAKFGKDMLNPNQLFIDFIQKTDDADHCTYFALRDMGIKEIPVYVNDETYEFVKALGLI